MVRAGMLHGVEQPNRGDIVPLATRRGIDHIVIAVRNLDAAAQRYESLGFTLTPRARHNTDMGTSNRLAQFPGGNFIELLEVDRPETLLPHDFSTTPGRFSFGAHNRKFLETGEGLSMLVLAGTDCRADAAAFAADGIGTFQPYEFERQATLPDGSRVTVAFGLAFAASPAMPRIAFFTCHNKTPEHFWKPAFQSHANGAQRIAAVYIAAESPAEHKPFVAAFTGGAITDIPGGFRASCGVQELLVLDPHHIKDIAPDARIDLGQGPVFAGFALETAAPGQTAVPATDACGAFIAWQPA